MAIKRSVIFVLIITLAGAMFSGCAVLSGSGGSNPKILLCVGDSITEGVGVADAGTSSYPAVLSKKMGSRYQVLNYGVAGSTVLESDNAYTATTQYYHALNSGASIVVIALGTNDCRTTVWDAEAFETAYHAIVYEVYHAKADADIYLVLPPAIGITEYNYSNDILKNEMIPIIQKVADEFGFETIDVYSAFEGKDELYADGLHPNEEGAKLIAEMVQAAIKE